MVLIWTRLELLGAARCGEGVQFGVERPLFDHVTLQELSINTQIHWWALYRGSSYGGRACEDSEDSEESEAWVVVRGRE